MIESVDGLNHNGQMVLSSSTNLPTTLAMPSNNNSTLDFGRKYLAFSPDHIQCLCEALQQKGDVEKLASFLWNLPSNEMFRSNESILRYLLDF